MSVEYVRRYYGVPAKRGGRVELETTGGIRTGRITRADHRVYVLFDDAKRPVPLHPCDQGLRYLVDENGGAA